jgi:hypothetical protein
MTVISSSNREQHMNWRTYEISVDGFPPFVLSAMTRSKARAEAYSRYLTYDDRAKFGDFVKACRVRTCPVPAADGYDYIRRAYGVDPKVGQRVRLVNEGAASGEEGVVIYPGQSTAHVRVVLDGRDFPVSVHPSSVELLTAA